MDDNLVDIIRQYYRETYSIKRMKLREGKRFSKTILMDNLSPQQLTKENKFLIKSEITEQMSRILGIDKDMINQSLD